MTSYLLALELAYASYSYGDDVVLVHQVRLIHQALAHLVQEHQALESYPFQESLEFQAS